MVNFWNEVDEALDKGKEDKLVKVRAKDLADFRTKLTELENEISFAQNRNQTLTEIKMDMAKQIELLQKSQSSLDHTVEGQIHNQAEMIEEIENELGEKQKEFAEIQAKAEKKDRLILEFKQKLEEAITKIKSQVTQNNDLSTKIQQLEVQNVDLQAELFQAKNEVPLSDDELAKQEQAISTLERENVRLQVDLGEREAEIQILKGKLENLTLNPQSGHRDKQIIEMQAELEKNIFEISQERQEFAILKKSMKQELDLAQMQISELEEAKNLAVSELEKEIMHLRNTHQQEIEHIRSQIAASGEITIEVGASGSADPQVVDLIAKLRVSNAKVQELQLTSRKLNNSLRKSQSDYQTIEAEVEQFRQNSVPKSEFETLLGNFNKLKEKSGALAKNREILLNENESLRIQLDTQQGNTSPQSTSKPIGRPQFALQDEEPEEIIYSESISHSTARIKCPRCESTKLKEVDDKTSIISYVPTTTYAKKTVCTQCGYAFK